jgi:hypothetical protein
MSYELNFEAEPFEFDAEDDEAPHEGARRLNARRARPGRRGDLPAWLEEGPSLPPPPSNVTPPQTVDADDAASWLTDVDAAIRKQFGLTGVGLAGRVRFMSADDFPKHLPASELGTILPNIFLEQPNEFPIGDVLRYYRMALRPFGSDEKFVKPWVAELRKFVAERIKAGYFEFNSGAPPPPFRKLPFLSDALNKLLANLRRMQGPQIIKLKPQQLAAMMLGGFTTGQPARANRRVIMPLPGPVDTLVHEGCHFYAHNAFNAAARTRGANNFLFDLPVSQILVEGFCEFFKRKVMAANQQSFGVMNRDAYKGYFKAARWIVFSAGEPAASAAYFQGNAAAINRLFDGIKANKENPIPWDRVL